MGPACVHALLLGEDRGETAAALAAQTRPVEQTLAAGPGDKARGVGEGLRTALAGGATWVWLIDAGVVPAQDALERLLEATALPDLPAPVLVTGKVTGPGGRLDPSSAPWPRLTGKDVAVAAGERHLLSVRAARHGSLLVHRRALELYGFPDPRYLPASEDLEWTARMLKHENGYLAPRSLATRRSGEARSARDDLRGRLAILRGRALEGEERLLFAQQLVQDAVARVDLRSRRR